MMSRCCIDSITNPAPISSGYSSSASSPPLPSLGSTPTVSAVPTILAPLLPQAPDSPQRLPQLHPEAAAARQPPPPAQPTSQILGATGGVAFAYSMNEELSRQPVGQLYSSDGKLYIEYVADTNVVFLPVGMPVERAVRQVTRVQQQRRRKGSGRSAAHEWAKPHNAFIRYRSWRLEEIKRMYPNANQVDLSRIAAEHWRNEDPRIKDHFQTEYKRELEAYHGKQKIQNMAAEHCARTQPAMYPPQPQPQPPAAPGFYHPHLHSQSHSPAQSPQELPAHPDLKRRRSSSAPHGAKPNSVRRLLE
ncbi:hypothetical protein H4R18_001349 [Coemansia javaensis]|uniref:HMG box domain-containing protein n=1 Tax=Coemansia javaensis TaxID=2761396 RepID=A0A9W8LLP3_9FUNG|nr:hypothetical protein H4R18_001349 [Coemansia javaensis]